MIFKALFLAAPEEHVSDLIKTFAERVFSDDDEMPTAIQALEVLDMAVHTGEASSFAITMLEALMQHGLKTEGITYEELVKQATWRYK